MVDGKLSPANRKEHPDSGLSHTLRVIFSHSWVNVLLVFVPFGIAAHSAGLKNPTITFALNALAIVPLTGLLTFATENVAYSRSKSTRLN